MKPPATQRHAEEFTERDLFLQMVLGLVSLSERSRRLVPAPREATAVAREDDPGVDALLGLIALREEFTRRLPRAEPVVEAREVPSSALAAPSWARDALR